MERETERGTGENSPVGDRLTAAADLRHLERTCGQPSSKLFRQGCIFLTARRLFNADFRAYVGFGLKFESLRRPVLQHWRTAAAGSTRNQNFEICLNNFDEGCSQLSLSVDVACVSFVVFRSRLGSMAAAAPRLAV